LMEKPLVDSSSPRALVNHSLSRSLSVSDAERCHVCNNGCS